MASEEENVEMNDASGDKENKGGKKVMKHDSGAADLEKVTDYVEEAEFSTQGFTDAMREVNDRQSKDLAAKQAKEKELSKVKINREDVDLIANEMEIPKSVAERKLREHKGNAVEALVELTN